MAANNSGRGNGYYFSKKLKIGFDEAIERVLDDLKLQGFGVISDIDVSAVLRAKLGIDFPRYRILGACNPTFAHKALTLENKIGTMLPCNVVVREDKDGTVEVAAVDPVASMQAVANPDLASIASEVQARLKAVIGSL